MQNIITKASPFFYAWRNSILRKSYLDFSKCSCHLHSYRKIRRCKDKNQAQLNKSYKETPLTYSIIHTLQKQFCSAYSTSTTSDPPDKTGQDSKINESASPQEDTPDFASVESKQEGLLDEEIEDFYREDEVVEEEVSDWVPPISLTRGKTGVYELEELLTVLREENAQDICVINIPPEVNLTDHMVIVSAISLRHLRAIMSTVNNIYKHKKHDSDPFLLISGQDDPKSEWLAVDLGNAFLHVMMPQTRQRYDIEGLWLSGDAMIDRDLEDEVDFVGDFDWVKDLQLKRGGAKSEKQSSSENPSAKPSSKTTNTEEDIEWIK